MSTDKVTNLEEEQNAVEDLKEAANEAASAEDDAVKQAPEAEEESEQPDASENSGESDKKEKRFGRKKDKNQEKVEKLEARVAELEDARVRQLAEFENFRKRSEKEKSQRFEIGARSVIEKILPIIDNFERGLAALPEEEKTPFSDGMELVYKQIQTVFEELGVKAIEAVGTEFDPNLHNAVMTVDDDSLESGTVAEELQKGYLYKDSVVRHSMVKVVN